MKQPKNRLHSVLIVGATPAGVAAANKLGELGVPITLVDAEADLDRKLGAEAYRLDSGVPLNFAHRPGLIRILRNNNIRCAMPAVMRSVKHSQQGFRAQIELQPTYVDAGRCTLCGQCSAACPLEGSGHPPIQFNDRMALPGRVVIDKRRAPLCQANCPLGVNVQGYLALAGAGRWEQALDLIRNDNVLPAVCGRICTHPCEVACRRAEKDGPLAIRDIKRFIADRVRSARAPRPNTKGPLHAERIAVIGAGPAGLAAAVDLARAGFPVTIYEKEQKAGGLLRYGIGPHRLPRDILDAEINALQIEEGIEILYGQTISLPQDLPALRQSYRAVILATGSWADRRLGVEGESLKGVEGCLAFLTRYYRGEVLTLSGEVAVIGDGNAAFDLARVLQRLGAAVTVVSWFARDEIPADWDEVHAAVEEGVAILDRCQAVGFHGQDGALRGLRLQATRPGKADASGICWPEIVSDSPVFEKSVAHAFVAIGQSGAYGALAAEKGLRITDRGLLAVDADSCTGLQGVYAAGDAATGATSVVHAMADGRRAAARVLRDLGAALPLRADRPATMRAAERDFDPIPADLPLRARAIMPELLLLQRRGNFSEVATGFDEQQAAAESQRCLQCGSCAECLACLPACASNQAIRPDDHARTFLENAGVLIIADPELAPRINGEDVIRAYGPPTAKTDVHAMMLRGYSAAAKAMVLLQRNGMRLKGQGVAFVPPDPGLGKEIRIGVFACRCNDSFGWSPAMDAFMQNLGGHCDIVHAEVLPSACVAEGIQRIVDSVRDKGLTRLVVASCVCCPLNFVCSACTDQRSRLKRGLFNGTGISRSMVQTCNLRGEVLRLIEKDTPNAERMFKGIIERSVGRARKLLPFPAPARSYNFTTAVIGQTEAASSAALTLAQAGFEVLIFGSASQPLGETPVHAGIFAVDGSTVEAISGTLGNFRVHARCADGARVFSVGAVILGEKSRSIAIYRQHEDLPELKVQSQMQKAEVTGVPYMYPCTTSISGLFLADPPGIQISKRTKGEAAAMLAAATMPRGPRQSRGFSVVVDEGLCRGCGRCLNACLYQAVSLKKRADGGITAVVDDGLCKGCGNCISVCPSNAADSPFRDQIYLEQTLEELLVAGSGS